MIVQHQHQHDIPISILNPPEAITRIDRLIETVDKRCSKVGQPNRFVTLSLFLMALIAQKKVIRHLNDENFFCQVPWDNKINMPSHPSLAADVVKYGDLFGASQHLKAFLDSFFEWTLLQRQDMECCCGGSMKLRPVSLEIMINTILKVENNELLIKFLLGIKSNDSSHLANHYSFSQQSEVIDDLHIILICQEPWVIKTGAIAPGDGESKYKAEEKCFSHRDFLNMVQSCLDEIKQE